MKISFFGEKTSHTFNATQKYLESAKLNLADDIDFLSRDSIEMCFNDVVSNAASLAVVPVENSVGGTVNETLDNLLKYPVYIKTEVLVKISQCLVVKTGADIKGIKKIYSHPQGLLQTQDYLKTNFPDAELLSVKSTSDALKRVKENSDAAIARDSFLSGLECREKGIEDYKNNTTRFLVLCTKPVFDGEKCSIAFDTENKPGALIRVLNLLAQKDINLTSLFSRPAKSKIGRYNFFADFNFSGGAAEVSSLLGELQVNAGFIKFLGKFNTLEFL